MPGESVLVIDDSPTILKVVQLVLTKAGYQVRTAEDGERGVELARAAPPDLILLDFVMPRMNGYQVCRALAEDEALKQVPIVLMSAKGDQVGERFIKVMGIVDYITKPFSPDAITAVVAHTIDKYNRASATEVEPVVTASPPESAVADGATLVSDPPLEDAGTRAQALAAVRELVARAIGPKLAGNGETEQATRAAADALGDELLVGMFKTARELCPELAMGEGAVLSGDLRVVPLAEVLQLLHLQAQSGTLAVTRAGARADVYFREGKVELAQTAGTSEEFLLGRFVVAERLMSREDLDDFLASRAETAASGTGGRLLGAQLVKLGYLSATDVKSVLKSQSTEIIYEILRWRFGRFLFRPGRELPTAAHEAQLGL
jgi:CheY-like chemotaxis protein